MPNHHTHIHADGCKYLQAHADCAAAYFEACRTQNGDIAYLFGALAEYQAGGDQEAETCTCGAA